MNIGAYITSHFENKNISTAFSVIHFKKLKKRLKPQLSHSFPDIGFDYFFLFASGT